MKHPKVDKALATLDAAVDQTTLDHQTRTNIKVLARRACTAAAAEVFDAVKSRRVKARRLIEKKTDSITPSGLKIVAYPAGMPNLDPTSNRLVR